MWLLGKENLDTLKPVLSSKYYLDWVKYTTKFLKYSKQKKYIERPENLLALQMAIAKTISETEAVIRQGKSELRIAKEGNDKESVKDIEIGITSNRQIVRILRTISDGIAWRTLNYDRPFIRLVAEPQRYQGSVDLGSDDFKKLENKAMSIVGARSSKVLLNDTTNFLRVGDLTEVSDRTIIWESKKSSKKLKSVYTIFGGKKKQELSSQMRKVVEAQIARDYREIPLGNEKVMIMDIPNNFYNFLPEVENVINEARENMFSVRKLSDYLIVSCTDQNQIINHAVKTGEHIWERFNDKHGWNKKHKVAAYSNLDFFYFEGGDFFRTGTPYTVYPFSNENIMGLVSGGLYLQSQLDITKIKKLIANSGWEVREVDTDKTLSNIEKLIPRIKSGKEPYLYIDDTIFVVRRGAFVMNIPMYWVSRIGTEFMKVEVLIEEMNAVYDNAQYGVPMKIQPFVLGERDVWK